MFKFSFCFRKIQQIYATKEWFWNERKCFSTFFWMAPFNVEGDFGRDCERVYTYTDKYIGHFFRQGLKGGKVESVNQVFEQPKLENFSELLKSSSNFSLKK